MSVEKVNGEKVSSEKVNGEKVSNGKFNGQKISINGKLNSVENLDATKNCKSKKIKRRQELQNQQSIQLEQMKQQDPGVQITTQEWLKMTPFEKMMQREFFKQNQEQEMDQIQYKVGRLLRLATQQHEKNKQAIWKIPFAADFLLFVAFSLVEYYYFDRKQYENSFGTFATICLLFHFFLSAHILWLRHERLLSSDNMKSFAERLNTFFIDIKTVAVIRTISEKKVFQFVVDTLEDTFFF